MIDIVHIFSFSLLDNSLWLYCGTNIVSVLILFIKIYFRSLYINVYESLSNYNILYFLLLDNQNHYETCAGGASFAWLNFVLKSKKLRGCQLHANWYEIARNTIFSTAPNDLILFMEFNQDGMYTLTFKRR